MLILADRSSSPSTSYTPTSTFPPLISHSSLLRPSWQNSGLPFSYHGYLLSVFTYLSTRRIPQVEGSLVLRKTRSRRLGSSRFPFSSCFPFSFSSKPYSRFPDIPIFSHLPQHLLPLQAPPTPFQRILPFGRPTPFPPLQQQRTLPHSL